MFLGLVLLWLLRLFMAYEGAGDGVAGANNVQAEDPLRQDIRDEKIV